MALDRRDRPTAGTLRSAEGLDAIVDALPAVVWRARVPERRFTYVSRHAGDMLGYPMAKWYRPGFWPSILHPEDRDAALALCLSETARGRDHDFEYRALTADGGVVWVREMVRVTPPDRNGSNLYGVMTDISEMKRLERSRDAHARRMADFAHIGSDWLWETDENHVFTYFSPQVEKVTGIPVAYHIGKSRLDLFRFGKDESLATEEVRHDPAWRAHLDDLEKQREFRDFGYWRPSPAGRPHYVSVSGMPVFDETGVFRGYRGVGRDLTRLKEIERELNDARVAAERADRMKSDFVANMSHEIRTPLNGVLGMADLLSRTDLDERQAQMVEVIKKSGAALTKVINDVLDLSRITSGWLEVVEQPFSVRAVVQHVVDLMAVEVMEKGLRVSVEVAPGVPGTLVGDEARVGQVITNLFCNAIKFTPAGQVTIDVGGERTEAGFLLRVAVRDTGVGIPADQLEAIFEPFRQVRSPALPRAAGTGLGLPISLRLARLMGGDIAVESVDGAGSTFTFRAALAGC